MPSPPEPLTWILTDGTIGMRIQCLGLAQAAGLTPTVKHIVPSLLLRAFPALGAIAGVPPASGGDPLAASWPDVVISCGRRTAGAAIAIKRLGGGIPFLAHIQDPRLAPSRFDLLIVPEHDPTRGANVIMTLGALNPHDPERLATAAEAWAKRVNPLPRPWIAVNVGGSNKRYDFSTEAVARFIGQLRHLSETTGGSLLVAASRRTDPATKSALAEGLADRPGVVWTGEGDNPYLAFLHLAEAIVVTSDSVNMVSEACSTGKPVLVASVEEENGRLASFHVRLQAEGYTRPFQGRLEQWSYTPLDETERVGGILRQRLGL